MKLIIKTMVAGSLLLTGATYTAQSHTQVAEAATASQLSIMKKESPATKYNKAVSVAVQQTITQDMANEFNKGNTIDTKKLNTEFIKLVNKDRNRIGIKSLKYNPKLQKGLNTRSNDMLSNEVLSHYRPSGQLWKYAFPTSMHAKLSGENVLSSNYSYNMYSLVSEKYLAEKFYKIWKSSPAHYKNMLDRKYKTTGIAVKVSGPNKTKPGKFYVVEVMEKK